jgi:transcriptional antiterminator NusG
MTDDVLRKLPGWFRRRRRPARQVFRLGDAVRVRSGPFASFTGRVEGINQSKLLLKVVVNVFGRATPLKLRFADVEKISGTEDE